MSAKNAAIATVVIAACSVAWFGAEYAMTPTPVTPRTNATNTTHPIQPRPVAPEAAPDTENTSANSEGAGQQNTATAPETMTPASEQLRTELALVTRASRALDQGDAAGALQAAQEHRHRFGGGFLGEESAALEIEALCELGRRSEAASARARFEQHSPKSPLRKQIAEHCGR